MRFYPFKVVANLEVFQVSVSLYGSVIFTREARLSSDEFVTFTKLEQPLLGEKQQQQEVEKLCSTFNEVILNHQHNFSIYIIIFS